MLNQIDYFRGVLKIFKYPNWYKYLSVVVVIAFLLYHTIKEGDIQENKFNRDVKRMVKGVITKKFIDEEEYMHKKCEIKNSNGLDEFVFDMDNSGLFDYLNVGD